MNHRVITVVLLSAALVGNAAHAGDEAASLSGESSTAPFSAGGLTDDVFAYDDGSAYWLTWGGISRGVWFDLEDFVPGASGGEVDSLEFWFYHHPSRPWDTSYFYAEVYNGDEGGPVTLIAQVSVSAEHFAPCYVVFDPPLEVPADFWVIVNTEMSGGGWPGLLMDDGPNFTGASHSFFSDDWMVWEPMEMGDYFIRVHGDALAGLSASTWGRLKTLF